jgi:F-type H+-transporting ATPase subunit a
MRFVRFISALLVSFALSTGLVQAQHEEAHGTEATHETHEEGGKHKLDVAGEMFGHVSDSHEWHIVGNAAVPLPVIAWTGAGLKVFSASNFDFHELEHTKRSNSYEGLHLERGIAEKLVADDGSSVIDLSITKNVLCMLIGVALLLWIMLSVGKQATKTGSKQAPKGLQNAIEPLVIFVRDEVAKPNLGYKYMRFMPLLLTFFFFIWIMNLLGLLPFGFNFTGNIAVTLCLALVTFIVMLFSANKHFWGHLFNPPGVPPGVNVLLVIIEIISLFIKPVALTIRLFANILAGHIVILSVIFMIFIFSNASPVAGAGFSIVSLAFAMFMFVLELLVAAIQAFIFTNLTAVFIGQVIEEAHHHDDAHDHHGEAVNETTGQHFHVSTQEVMA